MTINHNYVLIFSEIEDISVCPNNSKSLGYEFSHINPNHRVKLTWNESACNSHCLYPNPCIFEILAPNTSHIVMEFNHLHFAFFKKPIEQVGNYFDSDTDNYYEFTDSMTVKCYDTIGRVLFSLTTEGSLQMAPVWCTSNYMIIAIFTDSKQQLLSLNDGSRSTAYSSFEIEFYLHERQNCVYDTHIANFKLTFAPSCRSIYSVIPSVFACDGFHGVYIQAPTEQFKMLKPDDQPRIKEGEEQDDYRSIWSNSTLLHPSVEFFPFTISLFFFAHYFSLAFLS